jgi:hypothetical protein
MRRSFSPKNLVRLPHLDANGGLLLGEKLLAAAEAEPQLPESVAIALADVRRRRDFLSRIANERVAATAVVENHRKEVHLAEVAAWSALYARITAYGERAKEVEDVLFESGLKFLKLPYEVAWMEAERRLGLVEQRKLEDEVRQLAGEGFFEKVRETHRSAGSVLHITKPEEIAKSEPRLTEPLIALRSAVREYVVQVIASGSRRVAGAEALAERLLIPLMNWRSIAKSKKKPTEAAPSPPAPTPPASTPNPT